MFEINFNFATTSKFLPKLDIINKVEAGLRKVRDEAAGQIARSKVSKILNLSSHCKETSHMRKKRPPKIKESLKHCDFKS